ncbi:hypothetical protein N7450_011325 [Penicillium hetheringtonii]|uniref:DNA2/NAM7 helicase-like C-terminal domain-containing protein n=1 Tax=Penicillium hetheringtonii TaxID=911720 RepID=A0AAD6D9Q6_9EURO|nr:hypothetical protein N7450_011325 [Penicillium hetheringtonii]
MVVCAFNQGLNVIAQRFAPSAKAGVYRLFTEFVETGGAPDDDDEADISHTSDPRQFDAFREMFPAFSDTCLSDQLLQTIASSFRSAGSGLGHLSLHKHIIDRVRKITVRDQQDGASSFSIDEETKLLLDLAQWQFYLRQIESNPVQPASKQQEMALSALLWELQAGFDKSWKRLQLFIFSRAKLIFCTASKAGRASPRKFNPSFLLVEEASQITELVTLIPMGFHLASLRKIILSGDIAQLPPTVVSEFENEYASSEKVSLFERLIKSGLPEICLTAQYRMSPGICDFVSNQFYDKILQTDPSCKDRRQTLILGKFIANRYKCKAADSYFFSMPPSTVLRRIRTYSLVNPDYVSFIVAFVDSMTVSIGKLSKKEILVLSYYDEERQALAELLRKLGLHGVRVASVDSAQGSESSIAILSTTRPGGETGLGFLTDLRRACVALSRARHCLVVVGNERMAYKGSKVYISSGNSMWQALIKYHQQNQTLVQVPKNSELAREKLGIYDGHPDYERLRREVVSP